MTDDKVPVWIQRVARRYIALQFGCLGLVLAGLGMSVVGAGCLLLFFLVLSQQ